MHSICIVPKKEVILVKFSKKFGEFIIKQKKFNFYLKNKGGNYVNRKYVG